MIFIVSVYEADYNSDVSDIFQKWYIWVLDVNNEAYHNGDVFDILRKKKLALISTDRRR